MSDVYSNETEAFLSFAHGQVAAGQVDASPEELLARWRATSQNDANGEQASALDILQRAGLIGCIETHLHDLSTNQAHMEGFGTL